MYTQKLMLSGNNWFRMHPLESQGRISTAITPHPSHLHEIGAWQPLYASDSSPSHFGYLHASCRLRDKHQRSPHRQPCEY